MYALYCISSGSCAKNTYFSQTILSFPKSLVWNCIMCLWQQLKLFPNDTSWSYMCVNDFLIKSVDYNLKNPSIFSFPPQFQVSRSRVSRCVLHVLNELHSQIGLRKSPLVPTETLPFSQSRPAVRSFHKGKFPVLLNHPGNHSSRSRWAARLFLVSLTGAQRRWRRAELKCKQ